MRGKACPGNCGTCSQHYAGQEISVDGWEEVSRMLVEVQEVVRSATVVHVEDRKNH